MLVPSRYVIRGAMRNDIMLNTKEYFMDILSNALSDAHGDFFNYGTTLRISILHYW